MVSITAVRSAGEIVPTSLGQAAAISEIDPIEILRIAQVIRTNSPNTRSGFASHARTQAMNSVTSIRRFPVSQL
jgi:hypothetical protein